MVPAPELHCTDHTASLTQNKMYPCLLIFLLKWILNWGVSEIYAGLGHGGFNQNKRNHKLCLHLKTFRKPRLARINKGNPTHSPIGKYFPNSKYENVKNKQIQLFIFAPAGAKILDLFDSEHPYLESRKSLLREFTPKGDFILMATGVPAFL